MSEVSIRVEERAGLPEALSLTPVILRPVAWQGNSITSHQDYGITSVQDDSTKQCDSVTSHQDHIDPHAGCSLGLTYL